MLKHIWGKLRVFLIIFIQLIVPVSSFPTSWRRLFINPSLIHFAGPGRRLKSRYLRPIGIYWDGDQLFSAAAAASSVSPPRAEVHRRSDGSPAKRPDSKWHLHRCRFVDGKSLKKTHHTQFMEGGSAYRSRRSEGPALIPMRSRRGRGFNHILHI